MLLRNAKQLERHALRARDGEIGKVKDFYFDDHNWHLRYCVVDTGTWLQGRKVLISPVVMHPYDQVLKVFPVDLTIEQVRSSPDIDTDKPVSRQQEEALRQHYGWPGYWAAPFGDAGIPPITPPAPASRTEPGPTSGNLRPGSPGDPYLRSVNDTIGYHIEAIDGAIGHVEDFLIDDEDWRIRYLVIDTRNWWPGRKVIVAPSWIKDVSWEKSRVVLDLTRDTIKASPPYEPTMPWSEDYAAGLHAHYDRAFERKQQHKR